MELTMKHLREGPVPKIINGVFFYIGWGALVAGAAHGYPWTGSLLVLAALIFHFAVTTSRWRDLVYITLVALIGLALDTLLLHAGILSYASTNEWLPWIAPLWLALLYAQFATAIDQSMGWMHDYPFVAVLAGPFGGITSYSAAAEIGAVTFLHNRWIVLTIIGSIWLVFLPATFWLSRVLDKKVA